MDRLDPPDDGSSFLRGVGTAFCVLLTVGVFLVVAAVLEDVARAIRSASWGF